MATLYVTEQGATLHKEHNRFVVEQGNLRLAEIHEFKLRRVVIFGNAQITTQAMAYLLDRGIDTAFLSMRGRLKGRLAPLESNNVRLRLAQYERSRDARFALETARACVAGKIANSAAVLARHQRNHPECDLRHETAQLDAMDRRAAAAAALEELRGAEGQAAAVYFQGFARMLRRQLSFKTRTRRPPTDPVNALLGFGYALLYNEAISALVVAGFDPYVGFYHATDSRRCSLALDLMEELRPLTADRLALSLTNLETLRTADFGGDAARGVYLEADGRKKFLREYERLMTAEFDHARGGGRVSLRRALFDQAMLLRRAILREAPYQSFQGWR